MARKAVYKNPKSGKLYCFDDAADGGRPEIKTVFDNADVYDKAETKADKNGKAYKVCKVEPKTLKNGHDVFVTIAG